jgi:hypothetical protein
VLFAVEIRESTPLDTPASRTCVEALDKKPLKVPAVPASNGDNVIAAVPNHRDVFPRLEDENADGE